MNLKVVNISMRNAIMSREFYWLRLGIDCLNAAFSSVQPNRPQTAQIFVPQMPLNTAPLHVVLEVKNLSPTDSRELKMFRRLSCECEMKRIRVRREHGRNVLCPHRNAATLRPACVEIKASHAVQLELVCRYELLGRHQISFVITSSHCIVTLKLIVDTASFNPLTMLLTNELAPVAIDTFPAVQQALWLYNPYSVDVELRLISHDTALLSLTESVIVVKSHEHAPAFVTFRPLHVGSFAMTLGIVFNGCECIAHVRGECTQFEVTQQFRSPNFSSQLNPIVLHADNVCMRLPQHGRSSEHLIALQNGSGRCVRYAWRDWRLSDFSCEICVEPREGRLRAGATRLCRITVRSLGSAVKLQMIPVRCLIFRDERRFQESSQPDGYFEYTERGYYEKPPSDGLPLHMEPLTTLYVNVNVSVPNAIGHLHEPNGSDAAPTRQINSENLRTNVPLTTTMTHKNEASDDEERCMMETLISLTMSGQKYQQQLSSDPPSYLEIHSSSDQSKIRQRVYRGDSERAAFHPFGAMKARL